MEQTSQPPAPCTVADQTNPATQAVCGSFRARAFYHWKKPGEKARHGFAMGVVTAKEQTNEAVIAALKEAYPKLEPFDVGIDRLEWR
jgi:hypothetical protein